MLAKYKGFYVITEVLPNYRFRVQDLPEIQRTRKCYEGVVAIDQMKLYSSTGSDSSDEGSDNGQAETKKDDQQQNWIKDHFTTDLPTELTITEQKQLIDSDSVSKSKFASSSLPEFWIAMKKQYPIFTNKAIRTLIQYCFFILCEMGFSALAVIKTKYRGRLNTEKEMRIVFSKFTPLFDNIMRQKQAQPSH
ncbi:hypothetical protein QTP88_015005 [Uroleucon formosanum]